MSDLQALQDLLIIYVRRRSSRIRVDEQEFKRKLQNFRVRFDDQCRAFYRIVDAVNGREDWARLSPKEPSTNVTAPPTKEPGKSTPESSTSNPKITISSPPSPYQATVEEVEDDPSDEPSLVESYHYVHPMETPPAAPEAPIQTPPVVLVRAPTDGLEEQASQSLKLKDSSNSKYSKGVKLNDLKDRGTRSSEWSGWRVEDNEDDVYDPRKPSQIVAQTQHDERPLEDIQEEIIRLQAELDHIKLHGVPKDQSPPPPSGKRRTHHPSMDLGVTNEPPLDPYPSRRHRAMTTPSAEMPADYEADTEFRRPRRTPKPSPRERLYDYAGPSSSRKTRDSPRQSHLRPNHSPQTPQSAVEMGSSPWLSDNPIDEGYASNQKTDRYGVDPRRSLPMVNDSGGSTSQQGPGYAKAKRNHRYSDNYGTRPVDVERAFNDFLNSSEGLRPDFDLFGPSPLDAQPGPSRRPGESSTRNSSGSRGPEDTRPPPIEREVVATLEEIYEGTVKKFKIRRTAVDPATGRPKDEVKALEVPIYRGLKPGSRIKFQGEGGVSPSGHKQDLHFILVEKAHPVFTRRDRDLHTVCEIGLGESLLGWQRTIKSICGRTVKVSHEGPTPPSWQEPFAGLGMCSSKNVEERGDLIVGVKIKYPSALSERQKALIRAALMEK